MCLVTYYAYQTFKNYEKDADWVTHTERVKSEVMAMVSVSKSLSMDLTSVVINKDSLVNVNIDAAEKEIEVYYLLLDSLVADNEQQVQNLDSLKALINEHVSQCRVIEIYARNILYEPERLRKLLAIEGYLIDSIGLLRNKIILLESAPLKSRSEDRAKSAKVAPITLLVLALIAMALISYLFINTFELLDKNEKSHKIREEKIKELHSEMDQNARLQLLLRRVINSSTNGIQAFEAIRNEKNEIIDFRATIVNQRAEEIMEVSEEDQINSTLLTITPGNKEAGLFDMYVGVVNSRQTAHTVHYYEHDGYETWFDITAIANGDGFVVTFLDITEGKLMLRTLEKQKQDLETVNEELERFAYVASHDLQEPLRKIRTFGARLAERYATQLEDRGQDYITRMSSAAERMQILINDLLKFSRVSRNEISSETVSLNECLNSVLEILDMEIASKNAIITASELPEITGDASQMQQLFQNLLTNSLKYSKPDVSPEISISYEKVNKADIALGFKSYWKIVFKDNGIGFDNQYKQQIFEVFERLHGRTEYRERVLVLRFVKK